MQEGIAAGIRNFPVHKLVLICYSSDKQKADEFSRKLRTVLGMPVMISVVARENVVRDTMERVGEILNIHKNEVRAGADQRELRRQIDRVRGTVCRVYQRYQGIWNGSVGRAAPNACAKAEL
jgi:hypothetical protein